MSAAGGDAASVGGAPRVGVIGADLPRQIPLAAGAVPYRLLASWRRGDPSGSSEWAEASELLGAVDVAATGVLCRLLTGEHDELAGLIVCNDSAANLRLFYVLRELASRGRMPFPVHLLDVPRGSGAPREDFVRQAYRRLIGFCASIGGAIDAEALRRAAAVEGRLGAALHGMRTRRREGRCTGVQALDAYRVAMQAAPGLAVSIVDAARTESSTAEAPAPVPVLVSGSAHHDSSVYARLEEAGLVVVAEDHDTGDAAWLGGAVEAEDVDGFVDALVAQQQRRPPLSSRALASERAEATTAAAVAGGAAAVIVLARDLDDGPAWDVPALRERLAAHDLGLVTALRLTPERLDEAVASAAAEVRGLVGAGEGRR